MLSEETFSTGAKDGPSFGEATVAAFQQATRGDLTQLGDYASSHLGPAILAAGAGLLVIFAGYLAANYLSRIIRKPICSRVDETLGKFVGRVIFYTILLGVSGAVLSKLGAPLGGLAAMLAAAGFAIGLAFQGTLSNFAAGVLMLVFRPFKVGDWVDAAGVMGRVNEIDLFTTTLDTMDNRRLVVPNSSIAANTIENLSYHPHRRVEVSVGVDYAADLAATRTALEAATHALADRMIAGEERGAAVVLWNLGDSAVEWKVRMWVATDDYWSMLESLTGEVKNQLDLAGIGIPFPQMDIHLSRVDGAASVRRRPRMRPVRTGLANDGQVAAERRSA